MKFITAKTMYMGPGDPAEATGKLVSANKLKPSYIVDKATKVISGFNSKTWLYSYDIVFASTITSIATNIKFP